MTCFRDRRPATPSAGPRWLAVALAAAVLPLLALGPGCTSGRRPAFDTDREVGANVLLVQPVVRLGLDAREADTALVTERLIVELRRSISGKGAEISLGTDVERYGELRRALIDAWARARRQGLGRLRPGMSVDLGEGRRSARESGAATVMLAVLTRTGTALDDTTYVPRPPGEILPLPDDKPDYVIPQANTDAYTTGVDLDLILVSTGDEKVIAHRRVVFPARTAADIGEAVPILVREASRNLSR